MRNCLFFIFIFSSSLFSSPLPTYRLLHLPGPQAVHLLEIDPDLFYLKAVHADDKALGVDTVLSMCRKKGALAGINGGFFGSSDGYEGFASGNLKIEGNWLGISTKQKGAVGWQEKGSAPFFDLVSVKAEVHNGPFTTPIHELHAPLKTNQHVLYLFPNQKTTLTPPGSFEISVEKGQIVDVSTNGNSTIPDQGWVLASSSPLPFKKEKKVTFSLTVCPQTKKNSRLWNTFTTIVGGVPLLIHEGQALDLQTKKLSPSFADTPHARTAIGLLPNGHWLLVVVDGHQPFWSLGMTLTELSNLLLSLNCQEALNLDGGSSSSLVYNNKLTNQPDENNPAVANAILIFSR